MKKEQYLEILTRYLNGQATAVEENFLFAYYNLFLHDTDVMELLNQDDRLKLKLSIKAQIDETIDPPGVTKRIHQRSNGWFRFASVAAAMLLVIGAGLFYYSERRDASHEIQPGQNKAFLTLANGQKISLTDATDGKLANEAGVEISKTTEGELIYSIRTNGQQPSDLFNTIETPNGGQYQVLLPDGSRVWLNSASKLIYPVSFTGHSTREVKLIGEAYFEVVKDKTHPFIVKSEDQVVEVLGTHFNISSHPDEPLRRTTLLEGAIRLSTSSSHRVVLKPGQQATISRNQPSNIAVSDIRDLEIAVAWKKGNFYFVDESLEEVMKKIARWYDVEVAFEGSAGEIKMGGMISKKVVLSEVLNLLATTTSCDFTTEGRRVLIRKAIK